MGSTGLQSADPDMRTPTVSSCCYCLTGLLSLSYCFLEPNSDESLSWTLSLRIVNFLLFLNLLLAVWKKNSRLLLVFIICGLLFISTNALHGDTSTQSSQTAHPASCVPHTDYVINGGKLIQNTASTGLGVKILGRQIGGGQT